MTGNATADRPQPAGREAELEAELATAEALNAALEASRAELRESRERREAVVAHTAIGVGQTDLEGRFVLVNDRQCEILGRSREELLGGVRMLDVTHPEDRPANDALLRRMLETGEPFAIEKRYLRPDGSAVWVNNHVSLTRDATGRPRYVTALVQDVTERRRAEAALRERTELLASITDNAAEAIFLMDPEGRVTFANPAAERMFGWAQEELLGRVLHDVLHHHRPDGRPFPMAECPLGQVFSSHRSLVAHEDLFFRRDGSPVPIACSNSAIVSGGKATGAVLVVSDVTRRKRAEAERELLLAELNHRVKNILSTVQALASQTLKGSGGDPARFAGHFGARLKTLAHAHDLLTRGGWGPTGAEAVARAALAPWMEGGDAAASRPRFVFSSWERGGGPAVTVSPPQAQALVLGLHELATNAAKYGALSRPEGRVELRCDPGPDGGVAIGWTEVGGPAVPGAPAQRGFGTHLLERGLVQDLGPGAAVELRFEPAGLRATIRFAPAASHPRSPPHG